MTDRRIPIPIAWYLGAHGDAVAVFGAPDDPGVALVLHDDGTVTWEVPTTPEPGER